MLSFLGILTGRTTDKAVSLLVLEFSSGGCSGCYWRRRCSVEVSDSSHELSVLHSDDEKGQSETQHMSRGLSIKRGCPMSLSSSLSSMMSMFTVSADAKLRTESCWAITMLLSFISMSFQLICSMSSSCRIPWRGARSCPLWLLIEEVELSLTDKFKRLTNYKLA